MRKMTEGQCWKREDREEEERECLKRDGEDGGRKELRGWRKELEKRRWEQKCFEEEEKENWQRDKEELERNELRRELRK